MIGWLICRLSHKGFKFAKVVTSVSGARTAYAQCTKCGRFASAPIPREPA